MTIKSKKEKVVKKAVAGGKRVAEEAGAEGVWRVAKHTATELLKGTGEGAKSGAEEFIKNRVTEAQVAEKARVKFWITAISAIPLKKDMDHEKAAKKIIKIQSDYVEQNERPYKNEDGDKIPYEENAEDRLNKALGIFSKYIEKPEEMKEFQMRLASLTRKQFDSFIEIVLEDNMHRAIRFVSQFLQMLYRNIKNVTDDVSETVTEKIEEIIESLLNEDYEDALDALKGLTKKITEITLDGLLIADKSVGKELSKFENHLNKQWWVMQPKEKSVTKKIVDKILGGR